MRGTKILSCMLIYKFKISFEDYDDFFREIELRADQTFEDFHQAILGNLGLDPGMMASFFICDHRYRKRSEIQLVETPAGGLKNNGEPADEGPENINKALLLRESELKDLIDDPHQRLIFLYDYKNRWTFYIELIKIIPENKSKTYPSFSKSVGAVPTELVPMSTKVAELFPDNDQEFNEQEEALPDDLSDFDDIEDDEGFYSDQYDETSDEFANDR